MLSIRPVSTHRELPAGTRSASLFLVNKKAAESEATQRDRAYIFQAQMIVTANNTFVPRPDLRKQNGYDEDEMIADLQYRNDVEYAVGHNVSATALVSGEEGNYQCCKIYTNWMPQADVEKVVSTKIKDVNLSIEALGNAPDADTIRTMVGGIITEYTRWIAQQRADAPHRQSGACRCFKNTLRPRGPSESAH